MKCVRCQNEATSTAPSGEHLCDRHFNPLMAASPALVGTGTHADAFGAMVVAGAVSQAVHGKGHVPQPRHRTLLQRLRGHVSR